jgi:hypothetical protein
VPDLLPDGSQGPADQADRAAVDPAAAFTPAMVRSRYETSLKYQRKANQEYWLNHAFLEGHQWLWYDPVNRSVAELPRNDERVQATFNRLAHITRSLMSKYTQRELAFEVLPDEATDKAMTGAKIAESVVAGLHQDHDWETKRELLGRAAWKGGTAGVCVDWDPNAGKKLYDAGMSPSTYDAEPAPAGYEGDTLETVLSVAEIALQPGIKDGEKGTYWIKAQALPPEDVQSTYKMAKMPPADATAGMSPFQSKLLASHSSSDGTDEKAQLTLVLTYYERPNSRNKDGRVAVVVDNKFVVKPKPWPFPWTDRLNIALHRETLDEGRALGTTILSQARSTQVAYNAAWSNFLEHLKNAGNARLMIDASNLDLIDTLTDLPGEVIPVQDGTNPPAWLSPAQLEDGLFRLIEELRNEMDDQLGQHDVSRGTAPVNIESGYGLSILAEQDTSPVGRLVKDSAQVWSKVASMAVKLLEQMTMTTRSTTIQPDNYGPRTVDWSGDSFAGQTDVTIPLDGVLPRSRAAQVAVTEKFVQMGLVQDIETAAIMAELPGQKDLIAAVNPDLNRARKENYGMGRGKPAIAQPWDNHKVHITSHQAEMKNMEWDEADPQIQSLYLSHLQQHETLAAEAAGAAQSRAQVSPILATAPNAQGIPTIDPSALPQGSVADALPSDANGQPPAAGTPEAAANAAPAVDQPMPAAGSGEAISDLPPAQVAQMEGGG